MFGAKISIHVICFISIGLSWIYIVDVKTLKKFYLYFPFFIINIDNKNMRIRNSVFQIKYKVQHLDIEFEINYRMKYRHSS